MGAALRLHKSDQVALVDAEDLPVLERWRWSELNGYVIRKQPTEHGSVLIYLHRYLVQARPDELVDHQDRNRLNNQRTNLRRCTPSQNMANRESAMPHGYRGVYPRGLRWRAQIKIDNKNRYLGVYPTAEAAALAYDAAAREAFGRFARLNFPERETSQLALPLALDFESFPPTPRLPMDFAEISALRRAHTFTGDDLSLVDTSACLIPW